MELEDLSLSSLLNQRKTGFGGLEGLSKGSNGSSESFDNQQDKNEKEEGEISDNSMSDKSSGFVGSGSRTFMRRKGFGFRNPYRKRNYRVRSGSMANPYMYQSIFSQSQNSMNLKLEGKLALEFLSSQGVSFEYLVHLGINRDFLCKIFLDAGLALPETENIHGKDVVEEKMDMNVDLKDDKEVARIPSPKPQKVDIVNHTKGFSDTSAFFEESNKNSSRHVDSETFLQNIRNSIKDKIQISENIQKNVFISHKRKHVSTFDSKNEDSSVPRKKFGSESLASVVIEFSDDDNDDNSDDNSDNCDNISKIKKPFEPENTKNDAIAKLKQKEEEIKRMMEIIAKLESSKKMKKKPVEDVNHAPDFNDTNIDEENSIVFNTSQETKETSKNLEDKSNEATLHEKELVLQEKLNKINMQLFQEELLIQKLKNELAEAESLFQKSFQIKSDIQIQLKNFKKSHDSTDKVEEYSKISSIENLENSHCISENLITVTDSKNEIFISSNNISLSNQNSHEEVGSIDSSNDNDKAKSFKRRLEVQEKATTACLMQEETEGSKNNEVSSKIKNHDKFFVSTNMNEFSDTFKNDKNDLSESIIVTSHSQKNVIISSQSKDVITNKSCFVFYKEYSSPLRIFHAFRYHPHFLSWVKGGFLSRTYSTRSDPNKKVCVFETAGGVCNDDSCKFLHFKEIGQTYDQFLIEMSSFPVGETEEERQNYFSGLRELIPSLLTSYPHDTIKIAQSIIDYRKQFLNDPSRIILF
ncbi:hypothetical protein T552_00693 [Pneumocystis carinii B80]|uniref:C3H1-type domain-containing protein n=1 Tax=Pneumocystis carinii (strain B80) TaxID=1408658 RepID=A0A0W4ZP94_PNEC8|nr:hypothetical protein T552_00693 [Pneumocystis carinii B80]KTW30215.1 hypothetical protein T552_00693 [Pneumocystis carinii B80]